jgi:outer membrane protein assembly factor BamE (lipoprotein component of BamABCDE complex)
MRGFQMPIAILLIAICATGAACTYAKPQPRIVSGRQFPVNAASTLQMGSSSDDVRKILGEPLSVTKEGNAILWEYSVTTQHKEIIRLFGVVPMPAEERGGRISATLRFNNDKLTDVSVDRK